MFFPYTSCLFKCPGLCFQGQFELKKKKKQGRLLHEIFLSSHVKVKASNTPIAMGQSRPHR